MCKLVWNVKHTEQEFTSKSYQGWEEIVLIAVFVKYRAKKKKKKTSIV